MGESVKQAYLTVSITADSQLHIFGNLNLDHGWLLVDKLLNGKNDLVNIFSVNFLAGLESLCHIIDELLGHGIAKSSTVVVRLNSHRVQIKSFGGRWLIPNLDSCEEGHLSHNLLAIFELEPGIFIPGVDLDTLLEVVNGIFWSKNRCLGQASSVVCL